MLSPNKSSSKQLVIWKVSGLSTKTSLNLAAALLRSFAVSRARRCYCKQLWAPAQAPPSHAPHLVLSTLGQFLWCVWRWTFFLDSHQRRNGRIHRHIRSSVSSIEIAMHLKVQNSALSCSAHSSSHCSVHIHTTTAYHNMRAAQHELPFVQACAELVFGHDSLLISLESLKLIQLAF